MALRVKNIAAGFTDATGFHPIRRSSDYDPDRAGDDYGSKKDASGLKYRRRTKTAKSKQRATTVRRKHTKRRPKSRAKNPISTQWTTAKVRRTPGGDIQVMLARQPRKRVVRRRVARRRRR